MAKELIVKISVIGDEYVIFNLVDLVSGVVVIIYQGRLPKESCNYLALLSLLIGLP